MSFPISPIFLFADSQLLFHTDENGKTVLQEVRDAMEAEQPKAAYIGASNGDDPMFFSIFEAAMSHINITDCRMVFAEYGEEDRKFLLEADLILLAGGDVGIGWQALKEMQQDIIQRYYAGTVLCGVSAGAVHLGLGGSAKEMPEGHEDVIETFKLIPFYIDAHDEDNSWERLKTIISHKDPNIKGLGLPKGGGLIYYPDHTLEPLRQSLVEFTLKDDEVLQNLLLPGDGPGNLAEEPEDLAEEPG